MNYHDEKLNLVTDDPKLNYPTLHENYVIPKTGIDYNSYDGDYILNVGNFGVIIGNEIVWYKIGTLKYIIKTAKDVMIYTHISSDHSRLIDNLNMRGIDAFPENDPSLYSKKKDKEFMDDLNKKCDSLS